MFRRKFDRRRLRPGNNRLYSRQDLPGVESAELGGCGVEADRALNLLNDMLWQCLVVAAPILLATLAIGLVISVFQVATQIQEATLSYVPKILVAAAIMIALGPWMMTRITDFARGLYLAIPSLAS